jgi:23S rRNA (pseudouridine1915-N3)-methyltransferase
MFNITIIVVGKIKDKSLETLDSEYLKRIKPYAKIEIIEAKAQAFSASSKAKAKEEEGKRISAVLRKYSNSIIIGLDEGGSEFNSVEFAKFLEKNNQHIVFLIGGALGISPDVMQKIDFKLSLSQMTFPHEMARIVLLEQLYRAAAIAMGKEYHY